MSRRILLLASIIGLAGIAAWQGPSLLKTIPSRYVAAYFPEPLQELAEREHVDVLPTAQIQADFSDLLEDPPDATLGDDPKSELTEEPSATQIVNANRTSTPIPNSPAATPSALSPTPSPTMTPVFIPVSNRLEPVRHQFQTWNNCGPATLAMALSYYGLFLNQNETAQGLKPDPEDRNVSPEEMVRFVNRDTELDAVTRTNGTISTLKRFLAAGMPVIVELGLDPPGNYSWMGWYGHYLLLVAYDDAEESFWVYDSWFGTSEAPGENANSQGRMISYSDLDHYWRHFNRNYIALYETGQEKIILDVLGSEMSDGIMWQNSLARIRSELAEEPENAFLWFNLGTTYNALGEYENAATAFDKARAIGLPWRMLWYQFGPYEAYYQVGRYDDVILLADTTLMDRPYFEESYYYRGLAKAALGDVDAAKRDLERAARFNPLFTQATAAMDQLDLE